MGSVYAWLRNPKGWWIFWILSGCGIIINGYFDPYGGITLDGPWYLKLALSLSEGRGMEVLSPDYIFYPRAHYFHLWPPLYPILISCFTAGNLIPVWWAFKLVHWILLGWTLKSIWKYEIPNRLGFAALLFSGYWIDMTYQCWSEWPCICLIIIFFIQLKYRPERIWSHFMLMTAMWLIRYQLVLVPLLYVLHAVFLKRNKNALIGGVNLSIAVLFIGINYILPNHIWIDSGLSLKDIMITFGMQMLKQLNFIFCHHLHSYKLSLLSLVVLYFIVRKTNFLRLPLLNLPIWIGCGYIITALVMRSSFAVGIAHDRFYTFFLTCIISGILLETPFRPKSWLPIYILGSFFINIGIKNYYIHQVQGLVTFPERLESMQRFYKPIPTGSILVFGDKWTEFIRPDIYAVSPYELFMRDLSWKPEPFFSLMLKQGRPVYVEVLPANDLKLKRYDPLYTSWMKKHAGKVFIKLN